MAENQNTPQTRQVEALMAQVEHVRTHQPVVWDEHAQYAEDAADLNSYLRRMLADAAEALAEYATADEADLADRVAWLAEVASELTEALAEYDPMTIPAQLEQPPAPMPGPGVWAPSAERVEADRLMRALHRDGLITLVVSGGSDDEAPLRGTFTDKRLSEKFTTFGVTQTRYPDAPLRANCYGCGGRGCSACNHSVDCEPGMCASDCPTRIEDEGEYDPSQPCPACSFVGEHTDRECRENQQAQRDAGDRLTLDPGAANEMPDPAEDNLDLRAQAMGGVIDRQPSYSRSDVKVTLPSGRRANVDAYAGSFYGPEGEASVNWGGLGSCSVEDARAYAAAILLAADEAERMSQQEVCGFCGKGYEENPCESCGHDPHVVA